MKTLKYLIALIMAVLSVYLLYRLYITDEFTRLDYIFLIILMGTGMLSLFGFKGRKNLQ
jgi:hypothetical protein